MDSFYKYKLGLSDINERLAHTNNLETNITFNHLPNGTDFV